MNIKKIIQEEMDWAKDVKSALPNNSFLDDKIPVTLTVRDYLVTEFSYDFIDIILEDGRVIELTMEGDYDVKYQTYGSLYELVEGQGLSNPWAEIGEQEFSQSTMEDYLREFSMTEVEGQVSEVLRKVLPLDIKGIYRGSL
jgi:hypothetical protein